VLVGSRGNADTHTVRIGEARAVRAMLVRANLPLAAVTISGRRDSLDARGGRALRLARAHRGNRHAPTRVDVVHADDGERRSGAFRCGVAHAAAHDMLTARALIQLASLFAGLGNASLGSARSTQQTPYGDRTVISNTPREPAPGVPRGGARARDLSHRFIGAPTSVSFQRRAIIGVGGPAATIPINWGSVPTEGVHSLPCSVDWAREWMRCLAKITACCVIWRRCAG
jgi:hypothetical protein